MSMSPASTKTKALSAVATAIGDPMCKRRGKLLRGGERVEDHHGGPHIRG
jgi:hypothetical protein